MLETRGKYVLLPRRANGRGIGGGGEERRERECGSSGDVQRVEPERWLCSVHGAVSVWRPNLQQLSKQIKCCNVKSLKCQLLVEVCAVWLVRGGESKVIREKDEERPQELGVTSTGRASDLNRVLSILLSYTKPRWLAVGYSANISDIWVTQGEFIQVLLGEKNPVYDSHWMKK